MASAESALLEILKRVHFAETLLAQIGEAWVDLEFEDRIAIDDVAPELCAVLARIPTL